ncbi:crotonobetainyl-CoA:carnitine CoA-transferase CaiB-like acyl-CoA transferase [Neobacillus niacini]|uniref:CaiB/BaiF CoA transferase family protein n=1 Tax=Neobacillus niacini TaxID=86668 RepID=UPI002854CF51|nr:CaiB/BaiF CoA-transferase family protein [Neobacillus niacini]MDR7076080.1 crotonobetainyl-CoA:carnitine CoA-transferase CaiB-like acyl-CoA transferase [Neobacillus niacini]
MQSLEGIKVLDLSRTLAGPYCTMLLGDMGADVIKVEQPESGDETRRFTPPTWNGEATYYLTSNRNKRGITVDLKSPEGKEIIYKLAKEADIFVENFRTGAMDRLGFGYEKIKEINPRIVYTSISGFGRTGPEKDRAGYDVLLQGFGGLMSITGDPDGPPVKAGISLVDLSTGLFAVYGTLSALIAAQRTGKGQFIDVSLLDGQISLLNHLATGYFATGKPAGRMGSAHPSVAPYQAFRAKDMDFILAVANDRLWKKCCEALNWMDLLEDSRFIKNIDRVNNCEELVSIMSDRFIQMEYKEIFESLDKCGVPCGPIHTIDQILNHPHVKARDMIQEINHPIVNNLKVPGFPVKLSETPANLRHHPPLLGEHTDDVLSELGYSEEQIEELKNNKVV